MLDPEILSFFEELKTNWQKKKIKNSFDEDKKRQLSSECEEVYSLKRWVDFAAENAHKRALSSHPSKFSNPSVGASAKSIKEKNHVSPIIFEGHEENDGFLRTGNVDVSLDSTGNGTDVATIGEVGALLSKKLGDGKRFYQHIEGDTEQAKEFLSYGTGSYQNLKAGFLSMIKGRGFETNSKIKQVYFPVNDGYHLVSLLTNSGILFGLKERIDAIRFSETTSEGKKNKDKGGVGKNYSELIDITTIGFGGTQPNNISVLNNSNAGQAHLLNTMPPPIEKRKIKFPTKDFFLQSFRDKSTPCREIFKQLHSLYLRQQNNFEIREQRDQLYQRLIDFVIEALWDVRSVKSQYLETHSDLPHCQKVWLGVFDGALDDEKWFNEVLVGVTQFMFHGYEEALRDKAVKLGKEEYLHIESIIEKNKELLR